MNQSEKEIVRMYTQADMDRMISIQRALALKALFHESLVESINSDEWIEPKSKFTIEEIDNYIGSVCPVVSTHLKG